MAESKSQHFRCHVCLEVLKSPKILPCLHSFCQQCIHEIILSTVKNKEPKPKQFACPVCHTVVKPKDPTIDIEKWALLLQDNTAVATVEGQECHTCKYHNETSVASFWCKVCHEAFCKKCNTMHGWVKLTSTHDVIIIEDSKYSDSGIDLDVISEKCCLHCSRSIEAFCYDHDELCCILCLTSRHRECENVKTINEIPETKRSNETLEVVLQKIKFEMEKLLGEKEKKTKKLKSTAETFEEDALKFVQKIKCRLDDMFGNFIKQLRIIQDEQDSTLQEDVQFLTDSVRTLQHWIEVTEIVRMFGTKTQFFIHSKTMTSQIKESITQLAMRFCPDFDITLAFIKNKVLTEIDTGLHDIGTTTVITRPLILQTKTLYNLCKDIGIKPSANFQNLSVKNVRNIFIQNANITCGVFIDKNHVLVGGHYLSKERRLYMINIKTGGIVNIIVMAENYPDFKRLCFDKRLKRLFISSSGGVLMVANVREHILEEPQKLSFDILVGAVNVLEDFVYVVVNGKIQKFRTTIQPLVKEKLILCFETNTSSGLNGLAVHDGKLFYSSREREVKCSTIQGKELFCHKSASLKTPECLAVTPSGISLVVDRAGSGSLHALSSDGKERKILLGKFVEIKKPPMDVWIDDRGENICICGGQYIEVYMIDSKQ